MSTLLNLPPIRAIAPPYHHHLPLPHILPGFFIMDPSFELLPLEFFQEHLSALYHNLTRTPLGPDHDEVMRQIVETETIMRQRVGGPPLIADEVAQHQQQNGQQYEVPAAVPALLAAPNRSPSPQAVFAQADQVGESMADFDHLFGGFNESDPAELQQIIPGWDQDTLEDDPQQLPMFDAPPQAPSPQLPAQQYPPALDAFEPGAIDRFIEGLMQYGPDELSEPLPVPGRSPGIKRERSVSPDFASSPFREPGNEFLMGMSFAGFGQKRVRNADNFDFEAENKIIIPEESTEEKPPDVKVEPPAEVDEIQALFNSIRPDLEISAADRAAIQTPAALNITLKEYQKLGYAWLKKMELSGARGGILADDMGLGKTVQTLALLVDHRPPGHMTRQTGVSRTTLLVTPKSLLKQWENEILSKVKQTESHRLSVMIYHDRTRTKDLDSLNQYDVVITTYGVIAAEFKSFHSGHADRLVLLSDKAKWYRCVLDEAQTIKNRQTQMSNGCCKIQAKYRICLSGTPMQNHVQELYPLLKFLRIPKYLEWPNFNHEFVTGNCPTKMERLKALLCTVMLRRNKLSTLDGKPMITLPEKHVNIVNVQLSEEELKKYKEMEARTRGEYRQIMRDGSIENKYTQILVLLLRLRQIACHHYLTPSYVADEEVGLKEDKDGNLIIPPQIAHIMGKFSSETIKRVVESNILTEQECPVCFEPQEGNRTDVFFPCGHSMCADCLIQLRETQALENRQKGQFEDAENGIVSCPNCRGKVRTKDSLVDLKLFTAWCQRNGKIPKEPSEEDDSDKEPDLDPDSKVDADAVSLPPTPTKGADPLRGRPWASSAKVDKCIKIVKSIAANGDEKTLIFSQFTSLLDLISHALKLESIPFGRFDGSMHEHARNAAINNFQTNPHAKVLLISIKAGNTGLNLIQASQVIMMDPMYNPYVEHQAVDRAHRIGQQRDVTIHRLIAEGTIEDRILKRQEEKIQIVEEALQEGKGNGNGGKLKPEELKYLLFGRK